MHYGVFHKILSIITELYVSAYFCKMHLLYMILIGVAIFQKYVLLEHIKEITQWPFYENSVQKLI